MLLTVTVPDTQGTVQHWRSRRRLHQVLNPERVPDGVKRLSVGCSPPTVYSIGELPLYYLIGYTFHPCQFEACIGSVTLHEHHEIYDPPECKQSC